MNNALTTAQSGELINLIQNTKTIEGMKMVLAKIDGLKEVLKKAEMFREQSVKFAKLEAFALIRIAELDGTGMLKGFRKHAAEWLYSMYPQDREKYIEMCQEGLTIDQVWKREVKDKQDIEKAVREIYWYRSDVVDQIKTDGIVDLKRFDEQVRDTINDKKLATDLTQGIRRKLLENGAVGVGDKIYVIPNPSYSEEVKYAIAERVNDICAELQKLYGISKAANIKTTYTELLEPFENPAIEELDAEVKASLLEMLMHFNILERG